MNKMNISIDQIIKYHGDRIWYSANCCKIGIWDAEDIYQQLVVLIHEHKFDKIKTLCRQCNEYLPWNPAHVNRFLQSRALDFRRKETSKHYTVNDVVLKFHSAKVETVFDRITRQDNETAAKQLLNHVMVSISEIEQKILLNLCDPEEGIIALAQRDREDAIEQWKQGALKMNIHGDLVILKRHIAEFLGVSPATVSRTVKHAKELIAEAAQATACV